MQFPELTEEEEKLLETMGLDEEEAKEEQEKKQEEESAGESASEEDQPADLQKKEDEAVEEKPQQENTEEERRAAARYRYEAAEAKRKLAEREAELEALRNPKKEIPSQDEDYEGHVNGRIETVEQRLQRLESERIKQIEEERERNQYAAAFNELSTYESGFRQKQPDYDEASSHLKAMIATSVKVVEPHLSPEELAKKVAKVYLTHAAEGVAAGISPAQAIYEKSKQFGFSKAQPKPEQNKKDIEAKQFASTSANKKRSSGMGAVSGGGSSSNTLETVANMSSKELAEFSRLNPEELDKLMYG